VKFCFVKMENSFVGSSCHRRLAAHLMTGVTSAQLIRGVSTLVVIALITTVTWRNLLVRCTATSVATTTRYWDCSGGSCGCAYLPFGPRNNSLPAYCHSNAMFSAPRGNPYDASFYGTAAVSKALGGGEWLAEGCCRCWKVTGTSNISPYGGVSTTLVLKATNYCPPTNPACNNDKAHFDIAAPGFDFASSSLSNVCSTREANESAGFRACQSWMINSTDPSQNCDCSLFNDNALRDGCENFRTLYWDNVQVSYEEVTCPPELARLPCWEENGYGYPSGMPKFCSSNVDSISAPSH
jgi:hypothetical protein